MKVNDYYVNWDTEEFILYFKGYKKNKLDNSIIDETFYKEVIYLPINETDNIKEFEGSCEYMGLYNYYKIHQYPKDVSYKLVLKPYQKIHPYNTTNLILYYDIVFFGEVVYSGEYLWEFEPNESTFTTATRELPDGFTVEYEGQELHSEPVEIHLLPNTGGGDDDWEINEVDGVWYAYQKRLKWNEERSKIYYIPVGLTVPFTDYITCGINESFFNEKTYDGNYIANNTPLPYHIIQGVKDDWSDVDFDMPYSFTIQAYSGGKKTVEWDVTQTEFTYYTKFTYWTKDGKYRSAYSNDKIFTTPDFGQNLGDTELTYNFTKTETYDIPDITTLTAEYTFTVIQLYEELPFYPIEGGVLRFVAVNNDVDITLPKAYGSVAYSFDGINYDLGYGITKTVLQGQTMYVKAFGCEQGLPTEQYSFKTSAPVEVHGDVRSMLHYDYEKAILTSYCLQHLFSGTLITRPPELQAIGLAGYCYWSMFENCKLLKVAPELPATTLADSCYKGMFYGCTSLKRAPELPSTTLAPYCYQDMFKKCTSLVKAPYLPARRLRNKCYYTMFHLCENLSYIRVGATDWDIQNTSAYGWVTGVSPTGTFVKPRGTDIPIDDEFYSGIPKNWTVQNEDIPIPPPNYLRFDATTNDVDINFIKINLITKPQYSFNQNTWEDFSTTVTVPQGSTLYLRGNGISFIQFGLRFTTSAPVECHGDVRSLLAYENFEDAKLTYKCFAELFSGTSITTAPELPATVLADNCYSGMFKYCNLLTTVPELPATTLSTSCYYGMFQGCSSLTTPPELPSTALTSGCYAYMFYGCSNLTQAPELPADFISTDGGYYNYMFYNCSKINYIKIGASSWRNGNTTNWLSYVSSTGTFVTKITYFGDVPRTSSGIPSNWAIENF